MSTGVHPLPPPPACLTRSYSSRGIKGGTVIAEEILERSRHEELLLDPDGYRKVVAPCASCGGDHLHAHCFRTRSLRPRAREAPVDVVTIRLYLCASCRAVFTVLPAFIARHLWRAWETVSSVVEGGARAAKTTAWRWRARLRSDAWQLVQLFTASVRGEVKMRIARLRPLSRGNFLQALFPAAKPARLYISWEQFEANVRTLKENSAAHGSDRRHGPAREGPALLQGLVICGKCGRRMIALVVAAIASGRCHLAEAVDGAPPVAAEQWGWTKRQVGAGQHTREELIPLGPCVGWMEAEEDVYLDPESAFAAAQRLSGEQGTSLPVSARTLWKRLAERGYLASRDPARGKNVIRRTVMGKRRDVLHISIRTLNGTSSIFRAQ